MDEQEINNVNVSPAITTYIGGNNMADPTTDSWELFKAIKDARHDIIKSTDDDTDRLQADITDARDVITDRLFVMGRDTMDLRAQVTSLGTFVKDAATISAQATQLAVQNDGEKTRALINELKVQDLNRMLVERNAEIVEERHHARHWRGYADQSQFQNLQTMMQNFQSQLSDAKASMVNFGSMAGVGQSSTSNNVR